MKTICASTLIAALALPFLTGLAKATETFSLQINDVSGFEEPWPLIGGLPFPEGSLSDPDQIRLLKDGEEIPVQIDVASTWKDGSIRWALAGFTSVPQDEVTVEFGSGVTRMEPDQPLQIDLAEDGGFTINTGPAQFEFRSDALLIERAVLNGVEFLEEAGAGAWLVDNHSRVARVAGSDAGISNEFIKRGPMRVVVRREGWYVTDDNETLARARVFYYFSAGSPFVKITHSLIFTEDTNELWVKDYGLEFRSPAAPRKARFAVGGDDVGDLKVLEPVEVEDWVEIDLNGGGAFMLQDVYPHFFEIEAFGVVGRATDNDGVSPGSNGSYWTNDWVRTAAAVGDAGVGVWEDHQLTVVMPWMAQRFPKEIGFGPEGAHVSFWSGRSGRELDFRAVTLVNEYFQSWAERSGQRQDRGPRAATLLAQHSTNAQCAARTHDVWLLPSTGHTDQKMMEARAEAASHPPLVLADPVWLTATEAIGWPMHPSDPEQFPDEEAVIDMYWDGIENHYEDLRLTGFIGWGKNPFIRNLGAVHFRIANLVDYGLRGNVWGLYARDGGRQFYNYGSRFNRFAADWTVAHCTTGNKFKGGFVEGNSNLPFYWGDRGFFRLGVTGHDVLHWLSEYYLTGDEYADEILSMLTEAFKEHYDTSVLPRPRYGGAQGTLGVISNLYRHNWDAKLADLAEWYVDYLIDLDHPFGLNDDVGSGMYYKVGRKLVALHSYYEGTGDERAKEAFLRAVGEKLRFNQLLTDTSMGGSRGAFGGQNYMTYVLGIAYLWTGDPTLLRAINRIMQDHAAAAAEDAPTPSGVGNAMVVHHQMNPFKGAPLGMMILAQTEEEIEPFPTLELREQLPLRVEKPSDAPVTLSIYVRVAEAYAPDREPSLRITSPDSGATDVDGVTIVKDQMAPTVGTRQDARRWHFEITLPETAPAGDYQLEFPEAETIIVLESTAPAITPVRLGEVAN